MPAPELKLPYARPLSLSDPNHDFTDHHLKSMLATPDCDLKWDDFQALLGPYLPAGTYQESAYFLPLAFDYILTHDDEAHDLVHSLVGFSSRNSEELHRDGALDAVRAKLQQCLDHWTADFVIRHLGGENYVGPWHRRYLDIVHNSATLMSATNYLLEFNVHGDIALAFFADLAAADSAPVKSAWFLESARAYFSGDVFPPPKEREILQLLESRDLLVKHSAIVRHSLASYAASATYWRNTFNLVGTVDDM